MEQITSDIFMVGGSDLSHPSDACVYLIKNGEKGILVDSGTGRALDRIFSHVKAAGVLPENIHRLLLTHCHFDHSGGAAQIREICGCSIFAHQKDALFLKTGDKAATAATWYNANLLPFEVDEEMAQDRMDLVFGSKTITALHTPGHSPGSLVFAMESSGKKVVFGQDVHGPLDPSFHSNLDQYRDSLKKILALSADILCEGHFGVISGRKKVRSFVTGFLSA